MAPIKTPFIPIRRMRAHLEAACRPAMCAMCAVLLAFVLAPGIALAAKGDIDVLVAPDRTEAGKKFTPPTAKKPYYCMVVSAGAMELGAVVAGEKIPPEDNVAPLVKAALAKQYYLEIDAAHPEPSLVIVYSWGSINPDEMEVDAGDGETATTQTNRNQMLAIVATNNLDLHPNSVDRSLFVPDLSDGRYFILVGAYDYAALKAGKPRQKAMLWRTRLSTYNTGNGAVELADALPRMLEVGAGAFGADGYPSELRHKLKRGTVTIGEAQVQEYIVSGTDVRPAPPRQKKPGGESGSKDQPARK